MFVRLRPRRASSYRSRASGKVPAWLGLIAFLAALLALAPVLAHAQAGPDTVIMVWTAPGDDGPVGRASIYQLRITTAGPLNEANWAGGTIVSNLPAPQDAGVRERFVVRGLSRGNTYYMALKTMDDAGNWSPISNAVTWDWQFDTAPPAAPNGGRGTRESETSVRVRWKANSEPDLAGYSVYRSTAAAGPYSVVNASTVSGTEFVDSSIPDGTAAVWYQISATDDSGNESARSASFSISMSAAGGSDAAWTMQPAYPNPSRGSANVNFPVLIPASGAFDAELRITDAGGHVVRYFELDSFGPGLQTVSWDGRNQYGLPVAPGVYTALLIAGDSRSSVKLVRQP